MHLSIVSLIPLHPPEEGKGLVALLDFWGFYRHTAGELLHSAFMKRVTNNNYYYTINELTTSV